MQVYINDTDRTSSIVGKSVTIRDNLNEFVNTASFDVKVYPGKTYKPSGRDIVVIGDGDYNSTTKTFGTTKTIPIGFDTGVISGGSVGPTKTLDFGDLDTIGGTPFERVSIGDSNYVYRIKEGYNGIKVLLRFYLVFPSTPSITLSMRHSLTPPTTSTIRSHGNEYASWTLTNAQSNFVLTHPFAAVQPFDSGRYIWFSADTSATLVSRRLVSQHDATWGRFSSPSIGTLFGGSMVRYNRVKKSTDYSLWNYTAVDYTELLDRQTITEVYTNTNASTVLTNILTEANQKIDPINQNYSITADSDNFSNIDPSIASITFNGLTSAEAITKLAKRIKRTWYVDYDRKLYMKDVNSLETILVQEPSPTNTFQYIYRSLDAQTDYSQIRNVVDVRGASEKGKTDIIRTMTGDGSTKVFDTVVHFAEKPVVKVALVAQTVGIEYKDQDSSYDVMYSFYDRTIRFTGNAPANNAIISVTGKRQIPIWWREQDSASISAYGRVEYVINDKTITSLPEAIQRGESEVAQYKNPQTRGTLRAYNMSLRSGSRFVFSVPSLDLFGSAIINGVSIKLRDSIGDKPVALVEFSPIKEYGIIDYLVRRDEEDEEDITFARQAAVGQVVKLTGNTADSFSMSDSVTAVSQPPKVTALPENPFTGQTVQLTQNYDVFAWDSGMAFPLGENNLSGLTHDSGDNLVAIGYTTDKIYKHSGGAWSVVTSTAVSESSPQGLGIDSSGDYITVGTGHDILYKYHTSSNSWSKLYNTIQQSPVYESGKNITLPANKDFNASTSIKVGSTTHIILIENGNFHVSTNGGSTWVQKTGSLGNERSATSATVNNSIIVWVSNANGNTYAYTYNPTNQSFTRKSSADVTFPSGITISGFYGMAVSTQSPSASFKLYGIIHASDTQSNTVFSYTVANTNSATVTRDSAGDKTLSSSVPGNSLVKIGNKYYIRGTAYTDAFVRDSSFDFTNQLIGNQLTATAFVFDDYMYTARLGGIAKAYRAFRSIPLAATHPQGLEEDGGAIYVLDSTTNKIYEHNGTSWNNGLALNNANTHPTGMSKGSASGEFLVCDSNDDAVYAYKNGVWDTGTSLPSGIQEPIGVTLKSTGEMAVIAKDSADKKRIFTNVKTTYTPATYRWNGLVWVTV